MQLYPNKFASMEEIRGNITVENYVYWAQHKFKFSEFAKLADHSQYCEYKDIIAKAIFSGFEVMAHSPIF